MRETAGTTDQPTEQAGYLVRTAPRLPMITEIPLELPARLRSAQAAGSWCNAPFADLPHQHPYLFHQIVHRARHDCLRGQVGFFEPIHQSVRTDKTDSTAKAMQLIAYAFGIFLATKKVQLRQIVFDGLAPVPRERSKIDTVRLQRIELTEIEHVRLHAPHICWGRQKRWRCAARE